MNGSSRASVARLTEVLGVRDAYDAAGELEHMDPARACAVSPITAV